ncbi:MAG: hypothetical protein Q7J70_01230 [Thermodesulfovibrionales bacterium]|nr:hypothetical protein [Thermodesulfovibrionales bacterium]
MSRQDRNVLFYELSSMQLSFSRCFGIRNPPEEGYPESFRDMADKNSLKNGYIA